MRVRRCLVLFLGAVLSSAALPLVPFYPIPPAGATTGGPIRISANASSAQGNAGGGRPVLSGDGRLAAFGSLSTNLVPGDTNNASDFFLRDVPSGAISRASVAHLTGVQLNGSSYTDDLSRDGRYALFTSAATNLGVWDPDFSENVVLRDLTTGKLERIPNRMSADGAISDDNRYVAYMSFTTMRIDDTNGVQDVFLFDRYAPYGNNNPSYVSLSTSGLPANSNSEGPEVSADGRYVVYWSNASNLVANDLNWSTDVFQRDMQSGTTTLVSTNGAGSGNGGSSSPTMSSDGRYVAFQSNASDIVAGDTNATTDVFVRDLAAGTTTLVSRTPSVLGNGPSLRPALSRDGRYVAYQSRASNLVPGDSNDKYDIFVYDQLAHTTRLVSMDGNGIIGNGDSASPSISDDGRFVGFESAASNLVPGDTNSAIDGFVTDTGYLPPEPVPTGQLMGEGTEFASRPVSYQADPVNSATGAFTQTVVDAQWPAIGVPFVLGRTYNSNDPAGGPLGVGWTHRYSARLTVDDPNAVALRTGDGQQIEWTANGDGSYRPAAGVTATLTRNADGTFAVATRALVRYRFDPTGRLAAVVDRNDQGLQLDYDDATGRLVAVSGSGRAATFSYDEDGNLSQVTLPDGRSVAYSYTAGRLSAVRDLSGGVWSYAYEPGGKLQSIEDPNGNLPVRLAYDAATGRVSDQWDARDDHTTFSWDAATQTATATAPRGGQWRDTYAGNVLVRQTNPAGGVTSFEYDDDYRLTRLIQPGGRTSSLVYGANGDIVVETTPDGVARFFSYDANHNMVSSVSGRGTFVSYGYDSKGNLVGTARGNPGSSSQQILDSWTRDSRGLVVAYTDPRGKVTRLAYDAHGDVVATRDPLGHETTYEYDPAGRVVSVVDPRGNPSVDLVRINGTSVGTPAPQGVPSLYTWRYAYDASDRTTMVTDPLQHQWTRAYDPAGRLQIVADAKGRITTFAYDEANHLTSVQLPDPGVAPTQYQYDDDGNLASSTDANGRVVHYEYDLAGRLTGVTDPSGDWSFGYDAAGNRTGVTAPDDTTTTLGYDADNRLTTVNYPDGTPDVTYAYDRDGNRVGMTDGAGSVTYTYDSLSRPTSVVRHGPTTDQESWYAYDPAGNLLGRGNPDGTTDAFVYDDAGLLAKATRIDASTPVDPLDAYLGIGLEGLTTSYGYDQANNLTTTVFPNLSVETRTWDPAGRLVGVHTVGASTTTPETGNSPSLPGIAYLLDAVGNPIETIDADEVHTTYEYDALDRLTRTCFTAPCVAATDYVGWTYDGVGNRLTETRPSGTTTYAYDAADRLARTTGPSGTRSFGYDALGNQTQAGSSSFAYGASGRLASATVNGQTTNYAYDGDGRRLTASTAGDSTSFSWDPLSYQLMAETDSTGTVSRRYAYGMGLFGLSTPSGDFYYHRDAVGSPIAVTDADRNTQWTYGWEPFGVPRSATQIATTAPANPIGWAGFYGDDTGLAHARARQYDPTTGRFTSVDQGGTGQQYTYAANNPMTNADPLGLMISGRDIVEFVNTASRGIAVAAGGVAIACTATIVCAPAVPLAGAVAAGAGAMTAGTSIALAADTCTSHKGSCAVSILGAGIDTASGALAWSAVPTAGTARGSGPGTPRAGQPFDSSWPVQTATNDCTACAKAIQRTIGGQRVTIKPMGNVPVLGQSANNPAGTWAYHDVVVKNGFVYDGFTGPNGLPIDLYKSQFQYADGINFGF